MSEGGKTFKELSFAENFILSGTAAVIAKTASAPIERVKLMIQNQGEMLKLGTLDKPYKGVIDCTVRTFKTEGLLPFWRGNLPNCLRKLGNLTVLLVCTAASSSLVSVSCFILGYGVTVTAGLMSYPIDTIRRRMMMTSGAAVKYKGSIDCAVQIWKHEGGLAFMRGAGANILRGVAGAGVLAGFDKFKEMYVHYRLSRKPKA
ncbi:unnamed protein product [Dibothriocephalus latus]|uniref:ADP/ATP translocase n=1 Tax=Dibothriocephalus latus TaxID=60516 RepID=A0A3P7NL12_DIBLA|nr:unnamed protein product [Dibothriocephalus latus]